MPGPAHGDCSPGLPLTLLAGGGAQRTPHHPPRAQGPQLPRKPGCPVYQARSWHQLAQVLSPTSPQTLHIRAEPELHCPPLKLPQGLQARAPGRPDSVLLTGTASPSLGAPCWNPHSSWGQRAPPRTLRAAPGWWPVCSGPQGSTSGEGSSFAGRAGLPTAVVQPDPSATPRVMVWPQPPDLLGPCKALAGPGNPIPLSSLPQRLPGPPRASHGIAQPKPWFTRGSPHLSPQRVSVMEWEVPAQSPSADLC